MFSIDVPLAFAFVAGMAAAFNPCGAAMFPAYVGYQLDTFRDEEQNTFVSSARGILLGLAATGGFIVVFGTVGLILAAGGRVIGKFLPFAGLGVGIVIAGAGLYLLLSKRKLGIMAASRVNLGQGKGLRQVFLFGIAYAIASLSCALPIFLAAIGFVAGQSLSAGDILEPIIGSISYGLGMGAVLVAATVGVVLFKDLVQRGLRAVFPYIEPIGNLAMVGAGLYPRVLLVLRHWRRASGTESGRALLGHHARSLQNVRGCAGDAPTSPVVSGRDGRMKAAPHVVVKRDRHALRRAGGDQVFEYPIGRVLLHYPHPRVREQVVLQRLQLEAGARGHVADGQRPEIRQAGPRADRGELAAVDHHLGVAALVLVIERH